MAKKFGKDNVSAGILGGRAVLTGNGKSLRDILATSDGTIGVGMEGGSLSHLLLDLASLDLLRSAGLLISGDSPVPIRCVVGDFSVVKGIMQPDALLISTDVTNIRGKGTINLQNENIDLHFYVFPKEATLVSARAPLHIDGTFKHPSAAPDLKALGLRGGVATALALVAPPAALLAFIEPGLGSRGDCTGFIRQMDRDVTRAAEGKHTIKDEK